MPLATPGIKKECVLGDFRVNSYVLSITIATRDDSSK